MKHFSVLVMSMCMMSSISFAQDIGNSTDFQNELSEPVYQFFDNFQFDGLIFVLDDCLHGKENKETEKFPGRGAISSLSYFSSKIKGDICEVTLHNDTSYLGNVKKYTKVCKFDRAELNKLLISHQDLIREYQGHTETDTARNLMVVTAPDQTVAVSLADKKLGEKIKKTNCAQ